MSRVHCHPHRLVHPSHPHPHPHYQRREVKVGLEYYHQCGEGERFQTITTFVVSRRFSLNNRHSSEVKYDERVRSKASCFGLTQV
ncbi:hypothetical protein K1719_003970 [Acacia pycnantha]|nr:hypothetical protein K1719_003970 [Acacia pycnantha]